MTVRHIPTGIAHKGSKGGKTGCGIDTKNHSDHWVNTTGTVTCDKDGCKN